MNQFVKYFVTCICGIAIGYYWAIQAYGIQF